MPGTLNRSERVELERQARLAAYAAIVDLTRVQEAACEKFHDAEEECRRTYFKVYDVTLANLMTKARGGTDGLK
jgi:hypothetical protein